MTFGSQRSISWIFKSRNRDLEGILPGYTYRTHSLWTASLSRHLPPREACIVHAEAAVGLHVLKLVRETLHVLGNLLVRNTGQFRDLDVTIDIFRLGTLPWPGFTVRFFLLELSLTKCWRIIAEYGLILPT